MMKKLMSLALAFTFVFVGANAADAKYEYTSAPESHQSFGCGSCHDTDFEGDSKGDDVQNFDPTGANGDSACATATCHNTDENTPAPMNWDNHFDNDCSSAEACHGIKDGTEPHATNEGATTVAGTSDGVVYSGDECGTCHEGGPTLEDRSVTDAVYGPKEDMTNVAQGHSASIGLDYETAMGTPLVATGEATVTTQPENGTVEIVNIDNGDGTYQVEVTYTADEDAPTYIPETKKGPEPDDAFVISFPTATGTVNSTVEVDILPAAESESGATVVAGGSVSGLLPDAIAEGGSLNAFNIVTAPQHGEVTVDYATGEWTYTADADYAGEDTFTLSYLNTESDPDHKEGGGVIEFHTVAVDVLADTDLDGIANDVDTDDDNDGFSDEVEALAKTDSLNATSVPVDTDNDKIADVVDEDDDNDGVKDSDDKYPLDPTKSEDLDNNDDDNLSQVDDKKDDESTNPETGGTAGLMLSLAVTTVAGAGLVVSRKRK